FDEAVRIGFALPCNIERRPVINARTDYRKPQGDVDAGIEGQGLEGNVTLIVIHADVRVSLAAPPGEKGSIRRQRPGDLNPRRAYRLDRRNDESLLLTLTEEAILTCMRIEAADDEFWCPTTQALHGIDRELEDIANARHTQQARHVAVTHMDGNEAARQLIGSKHHAGALRAHALGENFGMPCIAMTCGVHGLLVQRRGADRINLCAQSRFDGCEHIAECRVATPCAHLSRSKLIGAYALQVDYRRTGNHVTLALPVAQGEHRSS